MRKILLALCLIANQAFAADNPIKHFDVIFISAKKVEVMAFNCETKNDDLLCNSRETTVSYYNWKKDDKDPEPSRCLISVQTGKDEYKMKSLGIWSKQERGGSCNTLIEYVIKPSPNGKVVYEQITLDNKDDDSYCVGVFGKTGAVKQYKPNEYLSRIPMTCSSIVMDP